MQHNTSAQQARTTTILVRTRYLPVSHALLGRIVREKDEQTRMDNVMLGSSAEVAQAQQDLVILVF